MTLDYGNNNLTRQLIVMGNGFDRDCKIVCVRMNDSLN